MVAVLVAGFLRARALAEGADGRPLEAVLRAGAKVTPLVQAGQPWRLVVAPLHHLAPTHLLANAAPIVFMGLLATRLLGPAAAWGVFLGGAWLSTAVSAVLAPELWSLGASGGGYALTGVLVGLLAAGPWLRRWRPRLTLLGAAALIALQGFMGGPASDGVAHLAGLALGLVVGLLSGISWRVRGAPPSAGRLARVVIGTLGAAAVAAVGAAEWALGDFDVALDAPPGVGHAEPAGPGCTWRVPPDFAPVAPPWPGAVCIGNGLGRLCRVPVAGEPPPGEAARAWLGAPSAGVAPATGDGRPEGFTVLFGPSDTAEASRRLLWDAAGRVVLVEGLRETEKSARMSQLFDAVPESLHCDAP